MISIPQATREKEQRQKHTQLDNLRRTLARDKSRFFNQGGLTDDRYRILSPIRVEQGAFDSLSN